MVLRATEPLNTCLAPSHHPSLTIIISSPCRNQPWSATTIWKGPEFIRPTARDLTKQRETRDSSEFISEKLHQNP